MPSPPLVLRGWPLKMMDGGERRANGAACIACRRLNPDVFEHPIAQHLAVGDAIECHAAREAQVLRTGFLGKAAGEAEHRLVQNRLDGGRDIHMEMR